MNSCRSMLPPANSNDSVKVATSGGPIFADFTPRLSVMAHMAAQTQIVARAAFLGKTISVAPGPAKA